MKVIRKRIPAHTTISYQCEVCGTKYHTPAQAIKCEGRILENKKFKIGDKARARQAINFGDDTVAPSGRIIQIDGPMLPDNDFEILRLGGLPHRISGHIFRYWLEYKRRDHKNLEKIPYFAPELQKIRHR